MTEATLKVSVIVPCHNAATYLKAALDSLLAQRPTPWEVIVVDDGSTDGGAAIAEAYGPPVRCFRQENQGIAATRNQGLRLANGDLIAFLDADDLWSANSLGLRLGKLAENPHWDGVYGGVEAFASPELSEEDRLCLQVPAGIQAGRLAGALLLKREVFERVGGFDTGFAVGETLDWIARAEEQGIVMGRVEGVVLRRRIHGTNTVRQTQRLQADYLRLLRAALARRRAAQDTHPEEPAA
ncbi:Glycosyl transferase family 2 [Methylomagnum ishizawai]|uniref:Glycosyl transferase family 2 n=1 Tax=Methylomagnum ishizawai TaxID=1760988 RepID=A0A1Y6D548_9GAMM|nr:glycosyltransferase family A protein [Methylomagnum ishizawai]SMF97726.1 Glycosyl transferase family 2 [Methylomagnum ishizawai]